MAVNCLLHSKRLWFQVVDTSAGELDTPKWQTVGIFPCEITFPMFLIVIIKFESCSNGHCRLRSRDFSLSLTLFTGVFSKQLVDKIVLVN